MKKVLLPVILLALIVTFGCSVAWVSTLDSILAAAAPALIDILQISALSQGKPFNSQIAAKVNADAAALKSTAADFASASNAAQPGACSQLQAALTTYEQDLPLVLSVAKVSNPNTQGKIETLSALIVGVFGSIEPLIPGCNPPAISAMRAQVKVSTPPMNVKDFVTTYNAVLVSQTGETKVDEATPKMKLHYHSGFVRFITLGIAK